MPTEKDKGSPRKRYKQTAIIGHEKTKSFFLVKWRKHSFCLSVPERKSQEIYARSYGMYEDIPNADFCEDNHYARSSGSHPYL
jgi:hypothetical protein